MAHFDLTHRDTADPIGSIRFALLRLVARRRTTGRTRAPEEYAAAEHRRAQATAAVDRLLR